MEPYIYKERIETTKVLESNKKIKVGSVGEVLAVRTDAYLVKFKGKSRPVQVLNEEMVL